MALIPVEYGMLFSAILFVLGLLGLLRRRNIIFMLMSIEIMLNAAGCSFIFAANRWGQPDGQVMFIFIITMAATEVAIALGLVLQYYHGHKSLNIDAASSMKG